MWEEFNGSVEPDDNEDANEFFVANWKSGPFV